MQTDLLLEQNKENVLIIINFQSSSLKTKLVRTINKYVLPFIGTKIDYRAFLDYLSYYFSDCAASFA